MVPKRGRTTTDRNRVKRRLRELVRLHILPILPSLDVVIYARVEAYDAPFEKLRADLLKGMREMVRALGETERA